MTERLQRALRLGRRGAILINLRMVFAAPAVLVYAIFFSHHHFLKVVGMYGAGLLAGHVFYFILVFALAYGFPPPDDRLEFPGAGRVIWPVVGVLAVGAYFFLSYWRR